MPLSPSSSISKAVLITGCSTGIGAATALRLHRAGWTVYASARRAEALAPLAAAGCKTLALDVADEASRTQAVATIEAAEGAVGALVNNAGYGQVGALETLPLEKMRAQFETNVFAPLRLAQLVLPGMRRQRWGRVVNVSSMGGKLTFPGYGAYHASKYALEAICDAMRYEEKKFGVDVVAIEPGFVRSSFNDSAAASAKAQTPSGDPFARFNDEVAAATLAFETTSPLARLGGTPEDVAAIIERALVATRPQARYRVTASARLFLTIRKLLNDAMWDRAMSGSFPQPGPSAS